jgi:hypothetical protein
MSAAKTGSFACAPNWSGLARDFESTSMSNWRRGGSDISHHLLDSQGWLDGLSIALSFS